MPAIITHDTFGREVYSGLEEKIGQSKDEKDAYLLGCQGPDVLFYGLLNPFIREANWFGSALHRYYCTQFTSALILSTLADKDFYDEEKIAIAHAYVLGYIMHHELDSKVHPFVYAQQYALCSAGVPGLSAQSESEVHVEIERELDELVLSLRRGETIASFDPSERILLASEGVLEVISKMFSFAISVVYNRDVPQNMYRSSVKASRHVQRIIYSTGGVKRNFFGSVETLFRNHSYIRAITHKNNFLTQSIFDNHEKFKWQNPWLENVVSKKSFWDLYNDALQVGKKRVITLSRAIEDNVFADMDRRHKEAIYACVDENLAGVNFYGCPIEIADEKSGKPAKIFK